MKVGNNFTQGKIYLPLVGFAVPVFLAILLQTMYGAVDMLVVGQFCDAAQVSAVSTGSWVMQTIYSGITGLAMGTTILLGQRIGEKKEKEGGQVVGASLTLFLVLGLAVTVVVLLAAPVLAHVMQAPEKAFSSTVAYMRIQCHLVNQFQIKIQWFSFRESHCFFSSKT